MVQTEVTSHQTFMEEAYSIKWSYITAKESAWNVVYTLPTVLPKFAIFGASKVWSSMEDLLKVA